MRFLKLLGLVGLVALEAGCGLPSPFFLAPPLVPQLASPYGGSPTFQIQSTSNNSEIEFRGFELYYKLYAVDPAGNSDTNLGSTSNTYLDLQAANFLPLSTPSDSPPTPHSAPLIPVSVGDRGKVFAITVNILSNKLSTYSYISPSTSTAVTGEVRRDVQPPAGVTSGPKTFLSQTNMAAFFSPPYVSYAAGDLDFNAIFNSVVGNQIYVMLYALSYGLADLSTPIYSSPVYLGYISLTIS